jgi:hypothetical protein
MRQGQSSGTETCLQIASRGIEIEILKSNLNTPSPTLSVTSFRKALGSVANCSTCGLRKSSDVSQHAPGLSHLGALCLCSCDANGAKAVMG